MLYKLQEIILLCDILFLNELLQFSMSYINLGLTTMPTYNSFYEPMIKFN